MIIFSQIQNYIKQIAEEKFLSEDVVEEIVLEALAHAYRYDYQNKEGVIKAKKNDLGQIEYYQEKIVVDPQEITQGTFKFDPNKHLTIEEAKNYVSDPKPGQSILFKLPYRDDFSRVAVQIAKNVMIQKLREIEKNTIYERFKNKEGGVVTGIIEKRDNKGNIYVDLNKTIGVMYKTETISKEIYRPGQRMRFYVYAVEKTKSGPMVYLSRAHPYFIPALFAVEVPEINEGIIQIKGVARNPGERTKMAVWTDIAGFDPIGACIGPKGARIMSISQELNGEKIDVILWDPDPEKFVANAIAPAKAVSVKIQPKRTMLVLVEEDQLPTAIGKNGQNINLASRLTNWRIDVRLAAQPEQPVEGGLSDYEVQ